MAKTRGVKRKTPPAGTRTVGTSSQRPSVCIRNRDYSRRMDKLNRQKVIFERGIYIEDFRNTPIPEIITKRKWQKFIKISATANMSLVKEFYASMNPEEVLKGGPVWIRGHEFLITEEKINAYFNTPNYESLSKGFAKCELSKTEQLKALRGPANGRWREGSDLKQSQLPQWLGFMHVFHSYSLAPVLHRTTISEYRTDLLYSYVTGTDLDVGQVILNAIIEAGRISFAPGAKPKQIIFPALITALLKEDGIEELSGDNFEASHMGDLNHRSWIDVVSKTKGRKKRKKTARGQSSAAGSDIEPESEEDDADNEAGNEAGGRRAMMDQVLDAIKSFHSRFDAFDSRFDTFEDEIRRHLGMPVKTQRAARSTTGISISEAQAAKKAVEEAAKKKAEDRSTCASKGKAKV